MIERPRLFTQYDEIPEIAKELETLSIDLLTITTLQHDEKKNWELHEASDEITRAYSRIMNVYSAYRDSKM